MGLYSETHFLLVGDRGLLLEFGDEIHPQVNEKVRRMVLAIQAAGIEGVVEQVPTYRSLLIVYNPRVISVERLKAKLESIEQELGQAPLPEPTLTRIPVVYGGAYGPDLDYVATSHQISPEEVIRLHCGRTYLIYMIGFMPGFPYLGGLPPRIATPRLDTPRTVVPAGSVGIAGHQTGIYPTESPGGWRLIGRTPVRLFDPLRSPPARLAAGDRIRFVPVSPEEYQAIERAEADGACRPVVSPGSAAP